MSAVARAAASTKVTISLHGRDYAVSCKAGDEDRVHVLAGLVEREMAAVASRAGTATEIRHMMLTCLSLADRLLEAQDFANSELNRQEDLFVAAVDHLKDRVASLASQAARA